LRIWRAEPVWKPVVFRREKHPLKINANKDRRFDGWGAWILSFHKREQKSRCESMA
jgi:hypothetical protein